MPQHKVDQVEEFARGKLRASGNDSARCALAGAQFVRDGAGVEALGAELRKRGL